MLIIFLMTYGMQFGWNSFSGVSFGFDLVTNKILHSGFLNVLIKVKYNFEIAEQKPNTQENFHLLKEN